MRNKISFLLFLSLAGISLAGCTVLTSGALKDPGESDGGDDASQDGGIDGMVTSCQGVEDGTSCGGDVDAGLEEDMVCRNGACVIPCGGCIEGLICNTNTWACEPICALACEQPEVCNAEKRKCEDPCAPDDVPIECEDGDVCIQGECVFDCTDQANGTWCNEEQTEFCQDGGCVVDECGNGYVGGAEGCDDGNEEPGDGCTACQPDCSDDDECDDGEACNGAETCASAENGAASCAEGEAQNNNSVCEHPDGGDASCQNGVCTPEGCGNSVLDDGEECDISAGTGNDANCVGCRWVCVPDTEGRACPQSPDLCKPSVCVNNACQVSEVDCSGTAVTDSSCQEAVCNGGECIVRFKSGVIDSDKDEHSAACDTLCDCNDNDPNTNCSAKEFCDGKNVDNDCNPGTTEPGASNYYNDTDKDGFGGAYVANTCEAPAGTTTQSGDCWDSSAYAEAELVNPKYVRCSSAGEHKPMPQEACQKYYKDWIACIEKNPTTWQDTCTSRYFEDCWDRDCDGRIEPTYPSSCGAHGKSTCLSGIIVWGQKGPAPCGVKGDWQACDWNGTSCVKPVLPPRPAGCGAQGNSTNTQSCY